MEFVFPIETREEFLTVLGSHCRKIEKPIAFEPVFLLFNRKIRDKTIYGNVGEDSFWLRAYNAKGYEARVPGRYCRGHMTEKGSDYLVKISWRFTPYWPLALILIYLIFLIDIEFSTTALFLSMPLYMVVCLGIFVVGSGMHEKEEQQIVELLKTIHADICFKHSKDQNK